MSEKQLPKRAIIGLSLMLVLLVVSIIVRSIAGGWFNDNVTPAPAVKLSPEFTNTGVIETLDTEAYNNLAAEKKTFLFATYLPSCSADLVNFVAKLAEEKKITVYYYTWENFRESPLHNTIKYAPSFGIVVNGELVAYLRSDSEADAHIYNSYEDFVSWIAGIVEL